MNASARERQRETRALLLSAFFWGLGRDERSRLRRTMRSLLDRDDSVADRVLILRAIEDTWPAAQLPAPARRVADFYLERPDVAARPGAYGA